MAGVGGHGGGSASHLDDGVGSALCCGTGEVFGAGVVAVEGSGGGPVGFEELSLEPVELAFHDGAGDGVEPSLEVEHAVEGATNTASSRANRAVTGSWLAAHSTSAWSTDRSPDAKAPTVEGMVRSLRARRTSARADAGAQRASRARRTPAAFDRSSAQMHRASHTYTNWARTAANRLDNRSNSTTVSCSASSSNAPGSSPTRWSIVASRPPSMLTIVQV